MVEDRGALGGGGLGQLGELRGPDEILPLHVVGNVLMPMPPNRVSIDSELCGKAFEARPAGAQKLDAPALGMAAYLAAWRARAHVGLPFEIGGSPLGLSAAMSM